MSVRTLAATFLILASAGSAWAGIVSTGSGISVAAPTLAQRGNDNDLAAGEYQSNSLIHVWFERTVTVGTAFSVEHLVSNTVTTTFNSTASLTSGTIAAGTRLSSYYLHFDPVTNGTGVSDSSGSLSITFDTAIVAVISTNNGGGAGRAGLDQTDDGSGGANGNAFQGPNLGGGTYMTYTNSASRGFALGTGATQDRYQISADHKTITILNAYAAGAQTADLRILVATPEPATLSLFGVGAASMTALVRRRRRRAKAPAG